MNELYCKDGSVFRVLARKDGRVLIIDCINPKMPAWQSEECIRGAVGYSQEDLLCRLGIIDELSMLSEKDRETVHHRFSVIAGILPFIDDDEVRSEAIERAAVTMHVSEKTVRRYLVKYLATQSKCSLIVKKTEKVSLTVDQKNIRWAINKFYFNRKRISLKQAYTCMLREKYTSNGELIVEYQY